MDIHSTDSNNLTKRLMRSGVMKVLFAAMFLVTVAFQSQAEETFPPLTLMKPLPVESGQLVSKALAKCGCDLEEARVETVVYVGDLRFHVVRMYLTVA